MSQGIWVATIFNGRGHRGLRQDRLSREEAGAGGRRQEIAVFCSCSCLLPLPPALAACSCRLLPVSRSMQSQPKLIIDRVHLAASI